MPVQHTKAAPHIIEQMEGVKNKNHPHLEQAKIAVEFVDSKPYVKDRLNLGKVSTFKKSFKLWMPSDGKKDFLISLCADVWYSLLSESQKEPYLDLLLTRCKVVYEPNTVEVNGKKQVVKDEWGRVEYSDKMKTDDEGFPIWKALPLEVAVIAENIKRYGVWYEDLVNLKQAIVESDNE